MNKNNAVLEIDKIYKDNDDITEYSVAIKLWFEQNDIDISSENVDLYLPRDLIIYRLENSTKNEVVEVDKDDKLLIKKLNSKSEIDRILEIEDIRDNNVDDDSYLSAIIKYLDSYKIDFKESNINKYVPRTIIERLENESMANGLLKGRFSYSIGF